MFRRFKRGMNIIGPQVEPVNCGFQSLFYWNWLWKISTGPARSGSTGVSILVLLELALEVKAET